MSNSEEDDRKVNLDAHGRQPWPTPDEMSDDQRTLYESIVGGPRSSGPQNLLVDARGRLQGPFNALLLHPEIGMAVQELGAAVRFGSSLSHRQGEIAILEIARLEKSDFQTYGHVRLGRAVGLTEQEIDALVSGARCASFVPDEMIVREIVRVMHQDRDLDDELFGRALELLGYQGLADIVVLVGYYQLLALSLSVWKTPLPSEEAPQSPRTTGGGVLGGDR